MNHILLFFLFSLFSFLLRTPKSNVSRGFNLDPKPTALPPATGDALRDGKNVERGGGGGR